MRILLTRREALDVPDGINIFLFSLAEALQEMGHHVTVFSSATSDLERIRSYYPLSHWPDIAALGPHTSVKYSRSLIAWLTRGSGAIRKLKPDFIIVNGAVPIRMSAKTCIVSHDAERRWDHIPYFRKLYKRYCFGKANVIVATCEEVCEALSSDLQIPPEQISVIPTCVNLESYKPRPLESREPAILHVGTAAYKNPIASLKAFAQMRSGHPKLYVTGKITQELDAAYRELPEETKARIELLGFVSADRLMELLGSVMVALVPSIYEAPVTSPTVIDAIASATPVVTSPSISRQVLKDGYNGVLCDPRDYSGMAVACDRLLSDEALWLKLSTNALESSRQFSARRIANMYLALASNGVKQV